MGVLNQDIDADSNLCRHIQRAFDKSTSGITHPKLKYTLRLPESIVCKDYPWWVLLLYQKEDSVLGGSWCHVSHKCHWAFCLVASHLEQVLRMNNDDRSVCKADSTGVTETWIIVSYLLYVSLFYDIYAATTSSSSSARSTSTFCVAFYSSEEEGVPSYRDSRPSTSFTTLTNSSISPRSAASWLTLPSTSSTMPKIPTTHVFCEKLSLE